MVGKPEGYRPLVGTRRKWEYNIKMNLVLGCGLDKYASLCGPAAGSSEHGLGA
jgi:hypothetical protein